MRLSVIIVSKKVNMKKIALAILSIVSLALTSCALDVNLDIDWLPVNLVVQVVNSEGKNLALPENAAVLEGTTIEFQGKTSTLQLVPDPVDPSNPDAGKKSGSYVPDTRAIEPVDRGFRIEKYKDKGLCLMYGELDGALSFLKVPFVITWPDGSSDEIVIDRKVDQKNVTSSTKWKLNGKECESPIKIVKSLVSGL